MNANDTLELRNPSAIRKMGITVLTRELGAVGMAYFIRQFDRGEGDYTRERNGLLAGVTMNDIERHLAEMNAKTGTGEERRS